MGGYPLQFETGPGDGRRIGGDRREGVNVVGGDEGRDLLAWPLIVPKLNRVERKLALGVDQHRPEHLSAGGDRAKPMSRTFNGLENTANALERRIPPVSRPLLRPAEAGHDLVVLPRA
jgi:hypothetical protein